MSEEIKEGLVFNGFKNIKLHEEEYELSPEEIKEQEENEKKLAEKEKSERLRKSGIGERYYRATLDSYECLNDGQKNALEKVKLFIKNYQEKTLWMVGKPGTGKTMLAAIICRECWGSHYCKSYEIEFEFDDCRSFKAEKSRKQLINEYSEYPLLIIDEIGKFESKDEIKYLFMIINERYEKRKSTVLISNKTKFEMVEYLGQPTFDRFTENCMSIEFNFDSYRINKRSK